MSAENTEWHILLGQHKLGPYNYYDIIRMLQTNQLMDFNYVWSKDLEGWTPIYQIDDFKKDKIRLLWNQKSANLASDLTNIFEERKNQRAEKKLQIIGHNGQHFFNGKLLSISESGALCMLNIPLIQVGDKLKVHVKVPAVNSERTSFNLEAVVVRKFFTKTRLTVNTELCYILKFSDLQSHGLNQIKQWCQEGISA